MSAVTIQQMADRISALMEERLGVRGRDLSSKLQRQPRALPKVLRGEAEVLARAAAQAQNPKLLKQIDEDRVARAFDACLTHLLGVDRGARWRHLTMQLTTSILSSLFVVGALVLAVLYWRGLL